MLPSPASITSTPSTSRRAAGAIATLVRQAGLGLLIATVLMLVLLFAGSEDRGFIYIDF